MPIHGLNRAPLNLITTTLNQSTSAYPSSHPHTRRHQSGQFVYVPSPRVCLKSQRSWVRYPVWQHTFVSPSADSSRAVVSFWRKYVHKVLVNRLGGLSLPRKSVGKLTDRPDMTIDVYHGRKTTTQPSPQTKIYQTTVKQMYTRTMFVGMTAPLTTNTLNQ